MERIKVYLALAVLCLLCGQGTAFSKTMYVTDRLYLSLRSGPDPEERSLALLPSDTKLDVLETEGKWAKVTLEDGRTGWVMKGFLVENVPKSLLIEQLEGQIESKNRILQRLRKDNAFLKRDNQTLKDQSIQQDKRLEMATKESKHLKMTTRQDTRERLKEMGATGIVGLLIGLIIGYVAKRPKRRRY